MARDLFVLFIVCPPLWTHVCEVCSARRRGRSVGRSEGGPWYYQPNIDGTMVDVENMTPGHVCGGWKWVVWDGRNHRSLGMGKLRKFRQWRCGFLWAVNHEEKVRWVDLVTRCLI